MTERRRKDDRWFRWIERKKRGGEGRKEKETEGRGSEEARTERMEINGVVTEKR